MLQAQSVSKSADQRPFPDVILKSQFFDTIGKRSLTSEQRLMLAVLADAINLVQEGHRSISPRRRTSFVEAKDWIFQSQGALPAFIRKRLRCPRDRCRRAQVAGRGVDLGQPGCGGAAPIAP